MKRPAFTLIELLVVIAIIGLLATFSVVQLAGARDKARVARGVATSSQILRSLGDDAYGIYDMDDCSGTNVGDLSGNGRNATIVGTGTWSTDTPSGSGCSLSLAGAGYALTPLDTLVGNNFTISVWFKTTDNTSYPIVISNESQHPVHLRAGNIRTCFTDCPIGTKTYNDGKWHLAVVVGDSKSIRTYMDGSNTPEITQPATTQVYTGAFLIGSVNAGFGYAWNGLIDEARFYNRPLTAQEIHHLYADATDASLRRE